MARRTKTDGEDDDDVVVVDDDDDDDDEEEEPDMMQHASDKIKQKEKMIAKEMEWRSTRERGGREGGGRGEGSIAITIYEYLSSSSLSLLTSLQGDEAWHPQRDDQDAARTLPLLLTCCLLRRRTSRTRRPSPSPGGSQGRKQRRSLRRRRKGREILCSASPARVREFLL